MEIYGMQIYEYHPEHPGLNYIQLSNEKNVARQQLAVPYHL